MYTLRKLILVLALAGCGSNVQPAKRGTAPLTHAAVAVCKDSVMYVAKAHKRGACNRHGGVSHWIVE
jgi:hypothetical protein